MPTDSEIRKNVTEELAWAPDVAAAEIGITVHNGVVTLLVHVPSLWEKEAAIRAARGVRGIGEELKVALWDDDQLSDEKIAARALFCLASDASIPNDLLKVTVENGIVTLTGQLFWHYQYEEAEFAVRKIAGVTGLVNQIALKPRKIPYDVLASVTQAFRRGELNQLDRIKAKVPASEIRLGGYVHTPHERDIAETALLSLPGVTKVENTIGVY